MGRYRTWVSLAALVLLLPLSLQAEDVILFQCVDDDGTVHFSNIMPPAGARCIRLGASEGHTTLDDKVKKFLAHGDGSIPVLADNVVQNGKESLHSFRGKLEKLAGGREGSLTVYFVGDSHLQSGDFVRGFLDVFAANRQVARSMLCVHVAGTGSMKTGNGGGRKRHAASRVPKDYPRGVPRICSPLLEAAAPAQPKPVEDPYFTLASPAVAAERMLRRQGMINAFAYGISGKTFEYFAGSELLSKDLALYQPDLIVVMLGTNDAFARPERDVVKRDITAFLRSVRRAAQGSEILFIGPPDSFFKDGSDNEYITVVRKELQMIARDQRCGYWDLYTVMGGARSMEKWRAMGLSQKDKVHFLADGYMILGRLFYQAVVQ